MEAEICLNIPGKSWNETVIGRLRFKNSNRAYHFIIYYTRKVDCLIRVYWDGVFIQSYRNGTEIWNGW